MALHVSQVLEAGSTPALGGDRAPARDLTALGVIGLRMSDLQDERNAACCGDCRYLALCTGSTGATRAVCEVGYATTLYDTWAARCLHFALRAPLPDTPPGDERTGQDRRTIHLSVRVERRSGRERRVETRP